LGQHDLQVIVHVLHAADALRRRGGLKVLRVTAHGAVEGHIPVDVPDRNIRRIDQRVEGQLCFDGVTKVSGRPHWPEPFPAADGRRIAAPNQSTPVISRP
jgi:hypothetical protein